ncbi:DUF6891 domain-containing protein [Streptomyces sp. NPDC101393]|uniref:DUF6891 domain-containing protein n=1 Tax=Streptomyces sp. NPDC101393 TaxID=3366141 RepID=UPI0038038041
MLEITVKTGSGTLLTRPTEAEAAALVGRIGGDDDHFLVAERIPEQRQTFVQTWRDGTEPFAVEYRDGGPDRHFGATTADPVRVAEVFASWARGTESWRTALDWRPADLVSTPGLSPETRALAEEQARKDIRSGLRDFQRIAQGVRDHFDPAVTPVSPDEARRIVADLWEERLEEQQQGPEVTDADRVAGAFAALDTQGLTARMDFGCCGTCGTGEIGHERAEGDHGFVFFHHQDTDALVAGQGLAVRYGAYEESGQDRAEVGRAVVAALAGVGLPVQWDGNPDNVISVSPLDWRKRLPTGA